MCVIAAGALMVKKDRPLFSRAPRELCILRLSAIGDVCHVLPIVHTLRELWPQTRITWIVGRLEYELLRGMPGVSFLVYDKKSGRASLREIKGQLGSKRFDVLLQMQMSYRASWIALHLRADLRLGFHKKLCKDAQWLFTHAQTAYRANAHVVDTFFDFLEALGLEERILRWDLPIPEEAEEFARTHLPEGQDYLIVQPGASQRLRNYRDWRVERYWEVIDQARSSHGLKAVLIGGPSKAEKSMAQEIKSRCKGELVDLVGKTGLKELLAVLGRATAIVSPDSGPMHMANALGIPTVGLFAGSNPGRTGPYRKTQYLVNAYPEAVRRYLGKDISQLRWGERVRHR